MLCPRFLLGSMDENPQVHPLQATERDLVDRLRDGGPADADLVELGRLLMRYEGFPGPGPSGGSAKTLRLWGLSLEQLHQRTRAICRRLRPGPSSPRPLALGLIRPIGTVLKWRSC